MMLDIAVRLRLCCLDVQMTSMLLMFAIWVKQIQSRWSLSLLLVLVMSLSFQLCLFFVHMFVVVSFWLFLLWCRLLRCCCCCCCCCWWWWWWSWWSSLSTMTRPPVLLSSDSWQSDRSLLHTCLAPWHYPSRGGWERGRISYWVQHGLKVREWIVWEWICLVSSTASFWSPSSMIATTIRISAASVSSV